MISKGMKGNHRMGWNGINGMESSGIIESNRTEWTSEWNRMESSNGMEWNDLMEWNNHRMESNGPWNGINGIESNGMNEWNEHDGIGMEWNGMNGME